MLAGLFVSFSRGAWLGAVVAGAALAYGLISHTGTSQASGHSAWGRATIGLIAILAALSGLALTLRGGGGSEGVRLLLWREALGYIQLHPLGIGLDQFYAYHLPDSGRSLIDPSLIGTSEQYAAHPHNLLLDIWLRMGPLGLIAFGWLTFRLVRQGWAQVQTNRSALGLGALAALAAALTHGLVDQFYFVPDLACAYWVLLALAGQATPEETP
jgi:O-antigen ligase